MKSYNNLKNNLRSGDGSSQVSSQTFLEASKNGETNLPQTLPNPPQIPPQMDPKSLPKPSWSPFCANAWKKLDLELPENDQVAAKSIQRKPKTASKSSQMHPKTLPKLIFVGFLDAFFPTSNLQRCFHYFSIVCYSPNPWKLLFSHNQTTLFTKSPFSKMIPKIIEKPFRNLPKKPSKFGHPKR